MTTIIWVISGWIAACSLYGIVAMGWDKRQAKKQKRRIAEKHFYCVAAIGGSVGVLAAMYLWRHKTYKRKFQLPVYSIFVLQILLGLFLYFMILPTTRI